MLISDWSSDVCSSDLIADEKLDYLLGRLRRIKHVEFIRLGTKVPTVLPMRITRGLTRMLRKHHPLWMSIHVTHPTELTPEATEAYTRLADAGIPLGSQLGSASCRERVCQYV